MSVPDPDQDYWFASELLPHEEALRGWLRGKFPRLVDVADLIQDAYVKVLETRRRAPERLYATKAFLFTVARNLALDRLRHGKVVPFEPLEHGEDDSFIEDLPGVAEAVGRQQELELLTEAVQSLPERCRQVMTMRKIYGLPQKEIARQLGISEHTVEAQVGLGVRRCAEYLARYGLP